MKVLVVSDVPTHPPRAGNSACILQYCELLRQMGHEVELLFVEIPWDRDRADLDAMRRAWGDRLLHAPQTWIDRLLQLWHHKVAFRIQKRYSLDSLSPCFLKQRIAALARSRGYRAVIINYWHLSSGFCQLPKSVRRILYAHDLFSGRFRKTSCTWLSTDSRIEGRAFDRADEILAIQEEEAAIFRTFTTRPVRTVFSRFELNPLPFLTDNMNLLFLAGPNLANVEGLYLFIDQVLPVLRKWDSRIQFLVGGRICSVLDGFSEREGLRILGEFEDVADFYRLGNLVINPVFTGSGLKIKSFEALSFGRAVVSHPNSLAGVFQPGKIPIVPAETRDAQVEAIRALFSDPELLRAKCLASLEYLESLNAHVCLAFQRVLEPDRSE